MQLLTLCLPSSLIASDLKTFSPTPTNTLRHGREFVFVLMKTNDFANRNNIGAIFKNKYWPL